MDNRLILELQCVGYLALYCALNAALFPSSLLLATIASFFAVKSIYLLSAALEGVQDETNALIAKICMLAISYSLVFGRLINVVAYALLGEMLLFNLQYKVMSDRSFRPFWFFFLLCPETVAISWPLFRAVDIASPATLAGFSEAFSGSEIEPRPKSPDRQ